MNIQKFTQKSMQAIQDCEKLAYEYGNQEIEQEHLLVALMRQEDGLIPMLIEKDGDQQTAFHEQCGTIIWQSQSESFRRTGLCRSAAEQSIDQRRG